MSIAAARCTEEENADIRLSFSYTCSLLGSTGAAANCANIGGNGTSGTYGAVAYCSDAVKLSYAFSAYYESQNRNSQACDFSGNATIVRNRKLLPSQYCQYKANLTLP